MTAALELSGVEAGRGGRVVLRGLDFALPAGGFRVVTGPSGAGKSTLLDLCAGALLALDGRVTILGEDPSALDAAGAAALRRRIGHAPQDAPFAPHLDVAENVGLPLRVRGLAPAARARHVEELLDWVGLSRRARALPAELSGGERRRAALARALVAGPELVVADEPAADADPAMARRLMEMLAALNAHGTAILIAAHDRDAVALAVSAGARPFPLGEATPPDPARASAA